MARKLIALFLLPLLLFAPAVALAQQASPAQAVTLTGSTGLAGQTCLTVNGSGSGASLWAQQTLTIPNPGGGNSVYIDYLMMALEGLVGSTTAATPVPFTTTGISGTPSFTLPGAALTIGQVAYAGGGGVVFNPPLKTNTASAVTVVGPAAITNGLQRITGCWHVAP
jgi:hypothetical protein